MLLELVHTSGEETTEHQNKVAVRFQAVLAEFDRGGDRVDTGDNYYISAGFSYAQDTYVWIGQKEITTKLLNNVRLSLGIPVACTTLHYLRTSPSLLQVYDFNVTVTEPSSYSVKRGHSFLLEVTVTITKPMSQFEFLVYQPLGYDVRSQKIDGAV